MIPNAEAAKAATMITDGLGLRSCLRGIGKARVLAHLNIYGEYDRLLECSQVRYTDGDGDGDDDDEQRTEASIDAEESRRDSYYDCGLRISPRLLCLIPKMTYTWHELRVRH